MLSFKHEVFLEVSTSLSFSKAAEVLFISQPAVSKHIKSLEEFYKVSLFERKGSTVQLTAAGNILRGHLLKGQAIKKQLDYEISTQANEYRARGELNIGASTTVALYILPPILAAFRYAFDNVDIRLMNRNSESILSALVEHKIDLGIVEGKTKISSIHYNHFITDEVVLVCSSTSELAKRQKVTLDELRSLPLALRERGSGTLAVVQQALGYHHVGLSDLNVRIRLGGTEALKNFILADKLRGTLGFLPMKSVAKQLKSGELTRIFIENFSVSRDFYFIQRHGSEDEGMNKAFIRFAANHYN